MNMDGFRVVHTEGKNNGLLKEQRITCGLTQQQVADKAGILIQHYQKFESGKRKLENCSMRIGLQVCAALELNPYELLFFQHQ